MGRAHTVDDYLETIYLLDNPLGEYGPVVRGGSVPAARVAEMLDVTPPTASEMLSRMEAEGLITRGPRRGPVLTERGRALAERLVRRHRLVERFLVDALGYSPPEAHERAGRLAAGFDDDMVERLAERLGYPERCPEGWPVDPAQEQVENLELAPLSIASAPSVANIVRLAKHDPELLAWFHEQGLVPGTSVLVEGTHPAADEMQIAVDGARRTISTQAAGALFVRFGACLTIVGGPLEGIVVRGQPSSAVV
jgi:DtxR family Mn-dependent transcriptional regulator